MFPAVRYTDEGQCFRMIPDDDYQRQHRQFTALKGLAMLIARTWQAEFADEDNPIDGSDAVDSLSCYVELAKDALELMPCPGPCITTRLPGEQCVECGRIAEEVEEDLDHA